MTQDPDGFVATLTAVSPNTRRAYAHDVAEFATWCERGGCPDPADLDHKVLRRYLGYLRTRGFARTSIARKAAGVRAYVRYLRRSGVLSRDVAVDLRSPKGVRRLPRVPRPTTRTRCWPRPRMPTAVPPLARRDLAVLELLYGAGLRVSECCGLDVGDVDLRKAHGHRARQGCESAAPAPRRAGARGRPAISGTVATRAAGPDADDALFRTPGAGGSPPATCAGSWPATRCPTAGPSIPTRCATRLRLISSREAPI